MNDEFVILAIHTLKKAGVLKSILENNGIEVHLRNVDDDANSFCVEVKSKDLSRALAVIEANKLFRYDDKTTYTIDDGRRRILVPVDFSAYSMKACRIAFSIAKAVNAKVKILHVYHDMYFPSHIPFADTLKETHDEGLLDKSRRKMLDLCTDIDKKISEGELPSVNYSYSLREGTVEEEIDNFVAEYKPSLLVLGTKGKGNNRNILGSVTADVIEMTNVPVLAIPENSPVNSIADIKHIAFLTNLQNRDLSSFRDLVSVFVHNPGIKITFVHINVADRQDNVWTEDQLMEIGNNFRKQYPQVNVAYKLISSPDIELALNKFVEEEKVNIISLTTRRRNIFGRMFMPSVSRRILTGNDVAIFVFR